MNMKYYNASNNFSAPVKREPKAYSSYTRTPEIIVPQRPLRTEYAENKQHASPPPLRTPEMPIVPAPHKHTGKSKELNLSNMKPDDLLLLGIITLLVWNSCDDTLLLLILGYLFLAGLK